MAKFLNLENVEKVAQTHPDTFFIPPIDERQNQEIGDSVRLHFLLDNPNEGEPRAERMWVTVTQTRNLLRPYRGTLENSPVYIDDLNIGDEVEFKPCHIARTIIKEDDPRWIDSAEQKALVSSMCFDEGECVRFLYREKADRDEDSGWRMFTGHESEEYTNEANNIRIVEVGWLLDRDPSLLEPLKQGVGAVYERDDQGSHWKIVTDWTPEE